MSRISRAWRKHLLTFNNRRVTALPPRELMETPRSTWLSLRMGRSRVPRRRSSVRSAKRPIPNSNAATDVSRKGHRSKVCWKKFPEKAPGYSGNRADTPAADKPPKVVPKKRDRRASSAGSDRGSEYEHSGNESDSSNNRGRRQRRKSNRIKTLQETGPMGGLVLIHLNHPLHGEILAIPNHQSGSLE